MPNIDDILKSAEIPFHDDKELGRFLGKSGQFESWSLTGKVDFPFQKDVPFTVELTKQSSALPESMPRNVRWLVANLGDIWNAAAEIINGVIQNEHIESPAQFSLSHFWAFIPDAPLERAEWRVEVEPRDMAVSFEVTFHGLTVVKHAVL